MFATRDPVIFISLIMLLALLILFGALIVIVVKTQRFYRRLYHESLRSELELLKEERGRISRDLHDDVTHQLHLACRQVEVSTRLPEQSPHQLPRALKNIKAAQLRIRMIIEDLDDSLLQERALPALVSDLLHQYEELGQLITRFSWDLKTELPGQLKLSIYRIVQELLHNTIKHSNAQNLCLELREYRRRLYFLYKDDGIPLHLAEEKAGNGLKNIQHRVLLLSGVIEINFDLGTNCSVEIPIL